MTSRRVLAGVIDYLFIVGALYFLTRIIPAIGPIQIQPLYVTYSALLAAVAFFTVASIAGASPGQICARITPVHNKTQKPITTGRRVYWSLLMSTPLIIAAFAYGTVTQLLDNSGLLNDVMMRSIGPFIQTLYPSPSNYGSPQGVYLALGLTFFGIAARLIGVIPSRFTRNRRWPIEILTGTTLTATTALPVAYPRPRRSNMSLRTRKLAAATLDLILTIGTIHAFMFGLYTLLVHGPLGQLPVPAYHLVPAAIALALPTVILVPITIKNKATPGMTALGLRSFKVKEDYTSTGETHTRVDENPNAANWGLLSIVFIVVPAAVILAIWYIGEALTRITLITEPTVALTRWGTALYFDSESYGWITGIDPFHPALYAASLAAALVALAVRLLGSITALGRQHRWTGEHLTGTTTLDTQPTNPT